MAQTDRVELPDGVTATAKTGEITVKGPKGELMKSFPPMITAKPENGSILVEAGKKNKTSKKAAGTLKAHLRNMVRGVTEGHTYKMKICSGHFPMNVALAGNELLIKNFFGEKNPRKLKIGSGVKLKVDGSEITIESASKEAASQCAASIEQLTRRTAFDRRVFMDGIYITSKDGKDIK